jgi:ankyrin repeat protein
MIAVAAQQENIVKYLLDHGADPRVGNSSALWIAAHAGDVRIIELLLANGADKRSFRAGFGTPRNGALAAGHAEAAELLK